MQFFLLNTYENLLFQKSYFNGLKINIGPTICEMNKTFFFLKIYLIEHKLNE